MNLKRTLPLLATVALLALPSPALAAPAGSTFLVSRPDGTGPLSPLSDNLSGGPLAVSADGRYVAFTSAADGFAPGANPRAINLFVRDTATGTTTLASRSDGANGAGVNADVETLGSARIGIAVAPGGQVRDAPFDRAHVFVVFSTKSTNLVDRANGAVPATAGREAVWMRDVTAGTTYLVSRASTPTGAPADGRALQPSIAVGPRGPLVAFAAEATNLDSAGETTTTRIIYLREMTEAVTQPVSCPPNRCNVPGGASSEPSLQVVAGGPAASPLCPTGERCAAVAFRTSDPLIGGPETSEFNTQIAVGRAIEKADGSGLGEFGDFKMGSAVWLQPDKLGNGPSIKPSLTTDGQGVAFISAATNLDPLGPALPPQPIQGYFHTFGSNATGLATVGKAPSGASVAASAGVRHLSVGGPPGAWRFGFESVATNLGVPNPFGFPRAYQVLPVAEAPFMLDRGAGNAGVIGDRVSAEPTLSADGSTAVFVSNSTNLNAGGGHDFARVYLRRIDPTAPNFNSVQLVSRPSGTGAFPSSGQVEASIPESAISADGRYVAFESEADDLSSADDNRLVNVFARDTVNGTTTLVSRANGAGGAAADRSSELNGISDDGQRVLYTSSAGNLGTSQPGEHPYVRDLGAQTTTIASRVNGPTGSIEIGIGMSISGNGNRVAFRAPRPLDPDADPGEHLYIRDLSAQTTTLADRGNGVNGFSAGAGPEDASLDQDGSRVAWTTTAPLGIDGQIGGHFRRVYVRDLSAGTTVLASRADGANGGEADGNSRAAALNAAGDIVAFESEAANLGASGNERAIWLRRLSTGRTELVSRANGAAGQPAHEPAFLPSIDASGERVAFVTHANSFRVPTEFGPPSLGFPAYVRDMKAKTTELVSRVNGASGAQAEPDRFGGVSISGSGDCVAFVGTGANYTDDYASADFRLLRVRVLRGSCGPGTIPAAGVAEAPVDPPAQLSRLKMQPTRFHVGPGGGTRVSFVLSEPSRVTLTFDRRVAGGATRKLALRRVGRVVVRGRAGANTVRFSGRVRGRALTPGRYRWAATPLQGQPSTGRFVVVRRPAP